MRKFGFTALVSFLFLLASCMNMGGSSGEDGAIRVALPGSGSRGAYALSKEKAKTYKVALLLDGENLKTQTSEAGGADIVFDELEPATYTVQVEAYDTNDVLLARKSETIKVTAGETAECSIALKLFASSVLDSGYILWTYSDTAYMNYYEGFSSISESIEVTKQNFHYNSISFAEDVHGNKYVMTLGNDNCYYIDIPTTNFSSAEKSSKISTDVNLFAFKDSLYYDDSADVLWAGLYFYDDSNGTNTLYFSKIKELNSNDDTTPKASDCKISIGDNGDIFSFAIQGNNLYFAYMDSNGTYYLQRASITENADGTFAVSKIGSAKSVSDLGVSGGITDIMILYDGTVYVLVLNVGNSSGDFGGSFNYEYNKGNTMYSRGALLKIQSTSSGFEVVDTLGWTGSSRQIAPVGEAEWEENNTTATLQPLTAYIPSFSENSNKFYGPRRFVAIKPKEIAIADCGANFVMPNRDKGQNGNMFAHNRVVTVSLSSFAISGVTKLENIKFSDLTLSGSGISGAWILSAGCDKSQNEQ